MAAADWLLRDRPQRSSSISAGHRSGRQTLIFVIHIGYDRRTGKRIEDEFYAIRRVILYPIDQFLLRAHVVGYLFRALVFQQFLDDKLRLLGEHKLQIARSICRQKKGQPVNVYSKKLHK